jgi:hypothetical protein
MKSKLFFIKKTFILILVIVISLFLQGLRAWNHYPLGSTLSEVIYLTKGEYGINYYPFHDITNCKLELDTPIYYINDKRNGISLEFNYLGNLINKKYFSPSIFGINFLEIFLDIRYYITGNDYYFP